MAEADAVSLLFFSVDVHTCTNHMWIHKCLANALAIAMRGYMHIYLFIYRRMRVKATFRHIYIRVEGILQ